MSFEFLVTCSFLKYIFEDISQLYYLLSIIYTYIFSLNFEIMKLWIYPYINDKYLKQYSQEFYTKWQFFSSRSKFFIFT